MHRHDLDLIAALAEGSLEDETAARAQVAVCRRCREELEAHTLALQALSELEPLALTPQESAGLRRDVWTTLRSSDVEPVRGAPWYSKWAYAAAGLVVIAGLAALLSQAGLEDAAEPMAVAEEAHDFEPAAEEPPEIVADAPDEDAAQMPAAPDFFAAEAARLRQGDETDSPIPPDFTMAAEDDAADRCLEEAGLVDHVVVDEVVDEDMTRYLVAVPAPGEIERDTPVVFVHASDCFVMAVEE